MCQFHYSLTNLTSRVTNESITVFTTTNFITESGTVTTNLFTVTTKYSTVTENDIVIQQVTEFVCMGNWEQVHTFAAVCKFWRYSSLPHLYNIEKVPMDGGVERRLNIGAFLRFLQSEHFRNVQCIFIPCRKTKGLFLNDVKGACPSVQTIVHSKWLMNNGSMEEIQERERWHPCYRVYRHDMPFTKGTNVWVKFDWDKKCKLVLESLFVAPAFLGQWNQIRTSFFSY
jgi:hypothetical protein